jgi:L-ascorbate metabolism protein UlaG (beta-lactamase superfamily)
MRSLRAFLSTALIVFAVCGCGVKPSPAAKPPSAMATSAAAVAPPTQPLAPTLTPVAKPIETPATKTAPAVAAATPALLNRLHYLGHASFRLDGPPAIYFDPTSAKDQWPKAGIILVSHAHSDHYVSQALERLSAAETVIIASPEVAAKLAQVSALRDKTRTLRPGERTKVGEVEIEAVPAYNIGKTNHPKEAENVGFVVTVQGERLYFAGDTDRIPEMKNIRCDVALLPIDGTYTMAPEDAALAAADIGPKVAIPMHMRSSDPEQFRRAYKGEVVIMKVEE